MPMVANVLITIHIAEDLIVLSGTGVFSCVVAGNNSALSTSSPISSSSGVFSFTKLPSELIVACFSLSSYVSASVTEEETEGERSVGSPAIASGDREEEEEEEEEAAAGRRWKRSEEIG